MKKVILVVMVLSLMLSQTAFAHAPSKIDLEYNPETKMLTATIFHSVEDPGKHYIAEITVAVNGKKVIEHRAILQDDKEKQLVSYRLPGVKRGDKITVEAACSINGVNDAVMEIE
ncbi:MAG: hypothetical protein WBD00_07530 [Candidatus Omnitrophota bacterium]